MGKLHDLNQTNMNSSLFAATLGDAHEHIVLGLLIRAGFEVAKIDVTSTPYDLIVGGYTNPTKENKKFLRIQVKTIRTSLTLKGGSRAGQDRTYKSDVKTYKYTTDHNDIMIGIDRDNLDLYIVPTLITYKWNSSISKSKLQIFKNNWDIFLNWNETYLKKLKAKV
jgi:hypothetical protein